MREHSNCGETTVPAPREAQTGPTKAAKLAAKTSAGHFLLAVVLVAAAYFVREITIRAIGGTLPPYVVFYPTVMLVALVCGWWPGVLATGLAALAVALFILPPSGRPEHLALNDLIGLGMFVSINLIFCLIAERYRRMRFRMEELVKERTRELEAARQAAQASQEKAVAAQRQSQRVEAELLASRAKLQTALNSTTDAILITDATGRFVDFNEAFATFHRFSSKADCAVTLAEYPALLEVRFADGELAPLDQWAVPRALRGETRTNVEYGLKRKDTGESWVGSYSFAPIRNADGAIDGAVLIGRDFTAGKRAEEALRESEARRSLALDAAHAGTWEWDTATGRNIWSDELWALYGLEPHCCEPSYEAWRQTVHPDECARVEQQLQEFTRQGAELNLEWRVKSPTDSPRWLISRGRPVRDNSGAVIRYLGVVMDITERKRAEEALRRSEAQFRTMFEMASIGMAQAAPADGRLLHVNRKLCEFTGYSEAELLQKCVREITHPEDQQKDWHLFQRVIRGEQKDYHLEKRYIRKDGAIVWGNVNVSVIRDAAGQPLRTMATIEDITERKRLEQERVAMEAQSRQQQKLESIGTLASGVAHEINNPINGILNYAQLIQDRLPEASPLAEFTGEIMRETHRVATIVRNLLTFARNDKQSHSPARMKDIVEAVLSLVRAVIRHDQIRLEVQVPEDLPQLKCRSQQVQQVIMNLITNARDALNERYRGHHPDKVLKLEARLVERAGRRWIRLTVEDHGMGIPAAVRERMFDPFFTTKSRDQGTGLGLSISHGIVKDHHGEWTVESEPGQFTRMCVELPVDNGWEV